LDMELAPAFTLCYFFPGNIGRISLPFSLRVKVP
jgi:hypothetical protein